MDAAPKLQGAAARALSAAAVLAAAPARIPLRLAAQWMAFWLGLLGQALCWLGVAPAGFVPSSKIRELNSYIEHMHLREDSYRQALKELQEALEEKEGDKKKALRNLKKTRLELDLLSAELAEMQAAGVGGSAAAAPAGPASAQRLSCAGLHWSMALLLAATYYFFSQDFPALQRKVVFSVLFPMAWFYTSVVLLRPAGGGGGGGAGRVVGVLQLYCGCWFTLGFILAHRFYAC